MKTKIIRTIIAAMVLILGFAGMAEATIVDISAATNKPVYELGEDVIIFVIAYNPNLEPVTLTFPSSMQASYLMDNIYDWKYHQGAFPVVTQRQIDGLSSYIWTRVHSTEEMQTYPLAFGTHTFVGEVLGYGQSTSVEFEVVPEPLTGVLIMMGVLLLRRRR